ncbi:hypothetical protein SAY87_015365 [Trapa incisa]|uniref:Uncharacterized protein n=1 Tax=Trapa incisa TaxID=236973 RepID=A0AAN7JKX7_9MYRT|nr:hypothetical protein SAY87_015365 [Trapa incisa]
MDKDGNKRKAAAQHHSSRSEDEDEEAKMEEFLALIRRTREIRDRINLGKSAAGESSNPNRKEPAKASYWTPKFVMEDFKDGGGPSAPPPPLSLSVNEADGDSEHDGRRKKQEGRKQDSTELNLELSLGYR